MSTTADKKGRILIVDDESPIREVLSASLRDEGHFVKTASDGESGLRTMHEFQPDVVFLDIWMPGSMDGIEVLTNAKKQLPQTEFVMISGHGTIETAVKATKLGAWDFIEKPLSMDKISIVIANILNVQQERQEKFDLLNKLRKSIALVGESPKMMELKQMISRVAPSPSWILLKGENGSGKELVAQNIHYLSPRASRAFVEVNLSTTPTELQEGELFGYEKGALPGLEKVQKGKVEMADGGTLFIDDFADLTPKCQEKVLRLLQEKKIQRVGGGDYISVDVRVIAASQKNIEKEVQAGVLSEALFHRINTYTFKVPALRDRRDDIPALVSYFGDLSVKEGGFLKKNFSQAAVAMMTDYAWPGNVRELKNFIERVYILTPGDFADVHDLRFAGLSNGESEATITTEGLSTFRDARAKFEKEYLQKKLAENSGNVSRTAEVIGLERSYLHRKIKAYGIEAQKGHDDKESADNI